MFFTALIMLLIGFPVAFTFGAVAVFFGVLNGILEIVPDGGSLIEGVMEGIYLFDFMPHRIYSIMGNTILIAVPLFVFMGVVLQKSKLAERLLESMGVLFGQVRGGLAISTIIVGSLLAASTGVVGASVVAMGVIALPVMLKHNYSKSLASGTICASGTLGQIIPPSIVLIILGDVFQVPVGDLFRASIIPSMWLVGTYIVYVLVVAHYKKDAAPAIEVNTNIPKTQQIKFALIAIIPPLALIILVLGSIFAGVATATESSAVGCVGALLLAVFYKRFSLNMLIESAKESVKMTSMVFAVLIGATAFSMVFTYSGGDMLVEEFMGNLPGGVWGFIFLSMISIMILGFFIDFIEISYIVVPILVPIAVTLGINPIWYAILIAMNLQTSFLTPPFGFSLFYLKGVAPANVRTIDIYKGVLPFILIQVCILILLVMYPNLFGLEGFL